MSYDGFYSIAFGGASGSGFGMLVLQSGKVIGADAGGVTYDGTYAPKDTGRVNVSIVLNVPAGVQIVQGVSRPSAWQLPINAEIPGDLGKQYPIPVPTPAGNVQVIFRKIRDL